MGRGKVCSRGLTEWRTSAVRGVTSEGFMTIVQPTASAGATFHALTLMNESSPGAQVCSAYHI